MASMPAEKRRSVYEEFLAVPDGRVAEIVHGELRSFPRPASRHARAATRLTSRLAPRFDDDDEDGQGGWVLLVEPEVRLHGHIVL